MARKNHKHHFCSIACYKLYGIHPGNKEGNPKNLKANNRLDEYSPFKYYLNKSRQRNKEFGYLETDLTLDYLKTLWDQQEGICPITGWKMELPPTTLSWNHSMPNAKRASLDRIEPKTAYCKGNVRFITHIANMAKHTYTDKDLIEFCLAVSKLRRG